MKKVRQPLKDAIKAALQATGESVNALAKRAGVSQPILQRFLAGKRGLTLETADKLCACLGLELKKQNKNP
jgi:transcriptional regulator with XRE-family HTH domain